jgi:hypothetical protein
MRGMNAADDSRRQATELVEAAQAFRAAAEQPASHSGAPEALESLEEALQLLSAGWYQLAADASPGFASRRGGCGSEGGSRPGVDSLSREREVELMGALHDIAASFARCARACRQGRSTAAPVIAQRSAAVSNAHQGQDYDELMWFEGRRPPAQRVA